MRKPQICPLGGKRGYVIALHILRRFSIVFEDIEEGEVSELGGKEVREADTR